MLRRVFSSSRERVDTSVQAHGHVLARKHQRVLWSCQTHGATFVVPRHVTGSIVDRECYGRHHVVVPRHVTGSIVDRECSGRHHVVVPRHVTGSIVDRECPGRRHVVVPRHVTGSIVDRECYGRHHVVVPRHVTGSIVDRECYGRHHVVGSNDDALHKLIRLLLLYGTARRAQLNLRACASTSQCCGHGVPVLGFEVESDDSVDRHKHDCRGQ
jgi:hypothetical protein